MCKNVQTVLTFNGLTSIGSTASYDLIWLFRFVFFMIEVGFLPASPLFSSLQLLAVLPSLRISKLNVYKHGKTFPQFQSQDDSWIVLQSL